MPEEEKKEEPLLSQADGRQASKEAILEAILFSYGAPISRARLSQILGINGEEMEKLLGVLKNELSIQHRGIRILEVGKEIQLGTAPEASPWVEKLLKEEFHEELTPASLETLAIVAYRGPIARAEVDYIRGVNSSFILRSLLIRGLITREPDPQRPYLFLYQPSFELLKVLGVASPKELPNFAELSKKLEVLAEKTFDREEVKTVKQLDQDTDIHG